jgi:inorganic phosphate transporter, PiT family
MGSKITRLHPVQGFCAEAGGAVTLFLATYLGIPVSTTHTITGAIIGVGAARKVAAVRWNVASNVVFAWIVTLPATALFGSVFYELGKSSFLKCFSPTASSADMRESRQLPGQVHAGDAARL